MATPKSGKEKKPGDTSHHHEGWAEHLSRMGLIHHGLHLPWAKIFLTLTYLGGAAAAAVLFWMLLGHWEDRRVSAREQGQADAADAARFMDEQLEEIVS